MVKGFKRKSGKDGNIKHERENGKGVVTVHKEKYRNDAVWVRNDIIGNAVHRCNNEQTSFLIFFPFSHPCAQ